MLLNVDVTGLEVVVAAELSQDKVLCQELRDGVDFHTRNQEAFNLPSRLIAKVLKFRTIYGGTEYSFAKDPDFMQVSSNPKYWKKVLEAYFEKYNGLAKWHTKLLQTVQKQGYIDIPSGRYFPFEPVKNWRGELKWPETQIKNFPVQGYGADLVKLARIEAFKNVSTAGYKSLFIQTIHDSLVYDCLDNELSFVAAIVKKAIEDVPRLAKERFNHDFSLPLRCELMLGENKNSLIKIA